MSNPWSVERWRLVGLLFSIVLIGYLTGNWLLAVIVPVTAYIAWDLYQAYLLEKWLRNGLALSKAPDTNGIWGAIAYHVYRRARQDQIREKQHKDSLNRLNSVVSAMPDAAVVLNTDMEIEWANKNAAKLLGIKRKRDVGIQITSLIRDPEFIEYLRQPKKHKSMDFISPANPQRDIAFTLNSVGKKHYLLTARDISERTELQRMRKAFIANASHELRTPLTVIAGYLEILDSDPDLPEDMQPPVQNSLGQAERMGRIIDDLLTLSRMEGIRLPDKSGEPVEVKAVVSSIIKDMQHTIAAESHEIVADIDDNLKLRAIKLEVEGIFMNLIRNAVLHTPPGTRVEVSWKRKNDGQLCFCVKDNGPGIPPKHLVRLTERFYRVDASRSRAAGGTGLGLSIVKHAVERHGGTLRIESKSGEGSDFMVCFPKDRVV